MTSAKNQNKTEEVTPKAATGPKLHAVKLLRNYRPENVFKVLEIQDEDSEEPVWEEREPDGEHEILDSKGKISVVASGDRHKMKAGSRILLPSKEAKRLLSLGVADPHSELV